VLISEELHCVCCRSVLLGVLGRLGDAMTIGTFVIGMYTSSGAIFIHLGGPLGALLGLPWVRLGMAFVVLGPRGLVGVLGAFRGRDYGRVFLDRNGHIVGGGYWYILGAF
jgi:hypothetical protein